jgi:hypothetical protein
MNTNTDGCIRIGTHWNECAYANDTAIPHFFTGVENFAVKEINVFEIAN